MFTLLCLLAMVLHKPCYNTFYIHEYLQYCYVSFLSSHHISLLIYDIHKHFHKMYRCHINDQNRTNKHGHNYVNVSVIEYKGYGEVTLKY